MAVSLLTVTFDCLDFMQCCRAWGGVGRAGLGGLGYFISYNEWIAADLHTSHSVGGCEWVSDHSEKAKLKISRDTVSNCTGTQARYSFLYPHPFFWMLLPVKKCSFSICFSLNLLYIFLLKIDIVVLYSIYMSCCPKHWWEWCHSGVCRVNPIVIP